MQVSEICPDAAGKRTLVMGIVNVTEDSFSDGGKWINIDKAIALGGAVVAPGADMLGVGGAPTRPGGRRVEEEVAREPAARVVEAVAQEGIMVTVDAMRASVARAAVAAGAALPTDASGAV